MHTFKTNKQNEYVAYLFQLNTIISAKARFGKSVKEHLSWGCLTIFGGEKGCLLRFIQLVLTLEELFLRISTNYLDTLAFVEGGLCNKEWGETATGFKGMQGPQWEIVTPSVFHRRHRPGRNIVSL